MESKIDCQLDCQIVPFDRIYLPRIYEVFHSAILSKRCGQFYDQAQREAWVPEYYDAQKWSDRISPIRPYLVIHEGIAIAYGDVQEDGYIDHFFVHGDFQGQGVGSLLLEYLLGYAQNSIKSECVYFHVSLCAQALFSRFGFKVIKKQQVEMKGVALENALMELRLK